MDEKPFAEQVDWLIEQINQQPDCDQLRIQLVEFVRPELHRIASSKLRTQKTPTLFKRRHLLTKLGFDFLKTC